MKTSGWIVVSGLVLVVSGFMLALIGQDETLCIVLALEIAIIAGIYSLFEL
jgi:hypothetical protein